MKKIILATLLSIISSISTAGTCFNSSISGQYIASGETAQRSGSIKYDFIDSGRFIFTGADDNLTGTVTYSGEEVRNNGNRFVVSGSGVYTLTSSCALTITINWTVGGVSITGVVYHLYSYDINTVPTVNIIYKIDGIESTSLLSTNPITFIAGTKSGIWSLKRVIR
jgi:hypothetical protein